jgi:hypothetical protein
MTWANWLTNRRFTRLPYNSPTLPCKRLKPPSRDYMTDERNVIEKDFHPECLAQREALSRPTSRRSGVLQIPCIPEAGELADSVVEELVERRGDGHPRCSFTHPKTTSGAYLVFHTSEQMDPRRVQRAATIRREEPSAHI